ncbi:tyrosine-type recombinase/integrase [Mycobacteroides abscessus]|uniref:tyrosine-type recombinase/integrase n=1 Tax=Mycobacteroides abscessus TaxID=36809 RepID=UPI001F217C30|nr:tyrosine-type recombinase/integrase [Mycobacteroides abscessus]
MPATIRKRPSKKLDRNGNPIIRYQVRWLEPVRDDFGVPTRRYRQRGEAFDTEEEANSRRTEVDQALTEMRMDPGQARDLASKPLGQYATEYFDGLAGTIDQETIEKYRSNYLLYVAPALGPRPVVSIRVADVKKLRSTLAATISTRTKRPLSAGTIKHAISVLRKILDTAVENEAIATNPAAVKLPNLRRQRDFEDGKRYTRLTVEQVATVAHWIGTEHKHTVTAKSGRTWIQVKPANDIYALAVLFSVAIGIRASELQGIEIQDIQLSEHPGTSGLVSVRRKKRAPLFKPEALKTENAYRDVPLDPWLADDLRTYLSEVHPHADNPRAPLFPGRLSRKTGKALGRRVSDSADMFDWTRPIDEQNVYKRFWLPALDALGYPHSRWHDLRHGFSVAALEGENVRDVSRWLGHSKISTTMDIYAAVLKSETGGKTNPSTRPRPLPTDNVVPLDRKAI